MGYGNFKQYDSRWGKKNYNGSSTMAMAGCGPTAVANLVHAVNEKLTPIDTMKFMQKHGYAVYNHGTAWSGIPACMKHFGLKDVKNVSEMSNVWKYLKKGYCAVFLFSAGSRGGICWTTSGHYVAVTNYKYKNGKHYLWTRDSGGRGHTGWYIYETHMKGLIPQIWVGITPKKAAKNDEKVKADTTTAKVKKPVKTKITGSNASKVNERAIMDAYTYGAAKSRYRYPSGKPKEQYKKDLNKAYPDRSGWWAQTRAGAACDVYVPVVLRATGLLPKIPHGLEYMIPWLEKERKKKNTKITRVKPKKDGKGWYFSPGMLKGGDFVVLKYKGSGAHTFFVVEKNGKKYFSEAQFHGKTYPHISQTAKTLRKSSYKMLRVYRAK